MSRSSQHPSFTLAASDAAYFDKIPAAFLVPLKLLHHEKMNYREIEQQTELAPGTVRSRIHRGREIIRRLRAEDEARNETRQEPIHA
jgi:DNA-directed RNA polymerase specialized sigma24 family protein